MAFRTLSDLPAPERSRLIYVAVGFMCVAAAALIARSAGDALFLSYYSASLLSYMYLGTAFVLIVTSLAFGAVAGRIPIHRLIIRACVVLLILILALRVALESDWGGFRIAAYVLSDLLVNIPMLLFWSFAALVFNPREAKRLYGFIGAGGTTACILAGFVVRPLASQFGTPNLLILVALLIAGFMLSVARLSKSEASRQSQTTAAGGTAKRPSRSDYYLGLLKTTQIRGMFLLVASATLTLTVVDYQFKAGARAHYEGAELAGFFGNFYAIASIVALVLQLFLVHRILQAGGVMLGLALLPCGLFLTTVGTSVFGEFSWMVSSKFIVQILSFTVDSAALQMLYLGIAKQSRSQARAFVEGIGKPLAIALTGLALVGTVKLVPLHILAAGGAIFSICWLGLVRRNSAAYVSALINSIGAGRLDLAQETTAFHDKTFETHVRQALSSAKDDEVPYLLDLLPEMEDVDWTPEFRTLLKREDPEVKISAIDYLNQYGNEQDQSVILMLIRHANPDVRSAAIYASALMVEEEAIEEIGQKLEDDHPQVRGAAVAAMINSGDLDRLLDAGVVLKDMLSSQNAEDREAAADTLAHIRIGGLSRPLIGLLQDSETVVRRRSLEACKRRPDSQLIPVVIPLLADPHLAPEAADALAAFESDALDHLIPYIELSRLDGAFTGSFRVPEILARIGDLSALPALLQACEAPDLNLRKEAIGAYCRLLQSASALNPFIPELQRIANREVSAARSRQQTLHQLKEAQEATVLRDALRAEFNAHLQNVFTLLDTSTPNVNMQTIYLSLTRGTDESRANALEVLDNVLEGDFKGGLLSLLESTDTKPPDRTTSAKIYLDLMKDGAPEWVTAGALYAATEEGTGEAGDVARKFLSHDSAVVRETALFALSELDGSGDLQESASMLMKDPDPVVRRLAASLSSAGEGGRQI